MDNEEIPEGTENPAVTEPEVPEEEKKPKRFGFIRRNAPTLMLSLALHSFILLIVSLVPPERKEVPKDTVIITDYIQEQKKTPEIEKIEVVTDKIEVNSDSPIKDESKTDKVEAESFDENTLEDKQPEAMPAIAPTDEIIEAMPSTLGLASNMAVSRMPSGYGNRSGTGKKKALGRYGGGGTQSAVELALQWLAEHQEPDGSWHAEKYEGTEPDFFNTTALALLPFLGAGHSENIGDYKKTVRNGIRVLNSRMNELNGARPHFGRNYGSGIALMTLSEASLFGSSPLTKKHAELIATKFIDEYEGKGWGYDGAGADLSVSGWVALGLKSGKAVGLNALSTAKGHDLMRKYSVWIDKTMTNEQTGTAIYSEAKKNVHGRNMMWVGMFQKQFLGFPKNDAYLVKAAENTVRKGSIDQVFSGEKISDAYGIYYGTLAAFQQQGEMWKMWNAKMKPQLTKTQRTGSPKEFGGSWDPSKNKEDLVAKHGGRVMVTSLMALCLEVYYRYQQMN